MRSIKSLTSLALIAFSMMSSQVVGQGSDSHKFSDWLKQIPPTHTEVFALNELTRHMESMLSNQALHRMVEEGPIGELLSGTPQDISPESWLEALETYRQFYPRTIVVAGNQELYSEFAKMSELLVLLNLGIAGIDIDYDAAEHRALNDETVKVLRDFQVPDLVIWLDWQDEAVASQLFSLLQFQVKPAARGYGFEIEDGKAGDFSIVVRVQDIADPLMVGDFIEQMGMEDLNGAMAETVLGMNMKVNFEQIEQGMRISTGPLPTRQDSVKPPAFVDGRDQIAFAKWNGIKARESVQPLKELMERWEDSELGKQLVATDTEDFWGTMKSITNQTHKFAFDTTARAWVEPGKIMATMQEIGCEEGGSLSGSSILDYINADSESYALTSTQSMAELTFAWMEQYEDELAKQWLKSDLRGQSEKAQQIDAVTSYYYSNYGPLREFIRDEMSEIDAVPFGFFMDTKGQLQRMEVHIGDVDFAATVDLDYFPRFAGVSETEETDELMAALKKAFRLAAQGIFSGADEPMPSDSQLLKQVQLDENTSATMLNLDVFSGVDLGVRVNGDFEPHFFKSGNMVVASSSLKLSKKLIASKSGLEVRPTKEKAVVSLARIRGKTIADTYKLLVAGIAEMAKTQNPDQEIELATLMTGLVDLINIMEYCDWRGTQTNDIRETEYQFQFLTR